jgi:hypothetical protein
MQALSEPEVTAQEPEADARKRWAEANKQAMHLMFGAQRLMVDEMAFAAESTLDRMRTETHFFGEFAAKLAESHSVQDWKAMGRDCCQHQLEFVRRDCDRLFRHGERVIAATNSLFNSEAQG